MRSLFETALQYLHGVPSDYYGVDVLDVKTTLAAALDDSSAIEEWRLVIDDTRPIADETDHEYAATLE
jgi:predicted metal-dependent hydrolase